MARARTDYQPGGQLSAQDMNQRGEAINNLLSRVVPGYSGTSQAGGLPSLDNRVVAFVVIAEGLSSVTCVRADETRISGSADAEIEIAKPPLFRGFINKTADDRYIDPPYCPDSILWAVKPAGGTEEERTDDTPSRISRWLDITPRQLLEYVPTQCEAASSSGTAVASSGGDSSGADSSGAVPSSGPADSSGDVPSSDGSGNIAVTVVTNVRVTATAIQIKTRTIYVPNADAESDWTTIHTGTNCD